MMFQSRGTRRTAAATPDLIIAGVIVLAIVVGMVAVLNMDTWGDRAGERNRITDTRLRGASRIDPALIHYEQVATISPGLVQLCGVSVGLDDTVYVAGDRTIRILDAQGTQLADVPLDGQPLCLAVGREDHATPGRVYVAMKDRIVTVDADHKVEGTWTTLDTKARPTSIAVGHQDIFLADAGNRIVLRYDTAGKLLGRIGGLDESRNRAGFVIPSLYFDLAVAPDGLLYVANPGALRLETYAADGDRGPYWGESGTAIERFYGCCNPAHFTILPDGRFVTSEKGLLRVKVYDEDGQFECVVAGPKQIPRQPPNVGLDVAADSRGRVLVLDPAARIIRVFQQETTNNGADQ